MADKITATADLSEPMIHVSSLSALSDVTARLKSFDILTMLSPGYEDRAPASHGSGRHLQLYFNDIVEAAPDLIAPNRTIVQGILDFGRGATDQHPLLIHCWAGISRSSAAAFMLACERNPGCEGDIADTLRARAPFATPNRLMIVFADDLLDRGGRMIEAIDRIGRGAEAFEGTPYQLPLNYPMRG